MMGYAENKDDLSKGDEQNGVLYTGDLAYRDKDGYYFLTGRLDRMLKMFGLRVNLDEVEKMLESKLSKPVFCYGQEDFLNITVESKSLEEAQKAKQTVSDLYHIHPSCLRSKCIGSLPYTSAGKKDYKILMKTEVT